MNNTQIIAIVPPAPWDLAQAAYDAVQAGKGGKPLLREVWHAAHLLWWNWWAEAVTADRGPNYLDHLTTDGWPGELDRLLADYPDAEFPWASMQELGRWLDLGQPKAKPPQANQLALFARSDTCPPWPHLRGGQVHYPSEATMRLEHRDPGREVRSLGLVPCSAKKAKQRGALPARELYQGCIFRAALRASERLHDATLIVSGAHGALHPDQAVPPYNYRLHGPQVLKRAWAAFTAGEIATFVGAFAPNLEAIVCYAGAVYANPLREALAGLLSDVAFHTPLQVRAFSESPTARFHE